MSETALQLIQSACYEANLIAPSALVGATDASTLQYVNLFYATGRELRSWNIWPQLKRRYGIIMQAGRNQYQLPGDFYAALPNTSWDQQNRWEMRGPMSDSNYNYRTYGYVTVENRKAFRVFGPDINTASAQGQFMIDPIPGAASAGQQITFEYVSKSFLLPPSWAPSTSYNGSSSPAPYVNVNGNIYQCATTGSHSSGTTPPSVGMNGTGRDGGVQWMILAVTAWANTTLYAPFDFVTNGGNLYVCATGGTSAGSGGPTGTSSSAITDGSVSWTYCPVTAWSGETTFAANSFMSAGGNYYKAVTPPNTLSAAQITGKVQPNWVVNGTTWKQTDNATSWNYYTGAYEALVTDSDLCLFDDELMIAGLKWRFQRAQRMDYQDLKDEADAMKGTAIARFNAGQVIDIAGGGFSRSINIPESFTES